MKLDDEVRRAEERIARRRMELAGLASDLGERTRDALASPAVLGTAVAVGFVLGKAMRRPRREAPVTRGAGWSDLLIAALGPVVRASSVAAFDTLWNRILRARHGTATRAPRIGDNLLPLNPTETAPSSE